jgi:hypothetical protein
MKNRRPPTAQSEAFKAAARAIGADESEERFDAALRKVGQAKLTHPPRPKKKAEKDKPAE